ncbi:hypothetical protein OCU04_012942 [Sclerotinia nivalis]|uniref:Uncharacterized protein n=1 Tax=Sclerotinia nivalis TaxID=352851 RepID=A0A9X0DEP9_9HELO|nr:hypothetical protein OCU04_012942 [Sclerotinia nivalis]
MVKTTPNPHFYVEEYEVYKYKLRHGHSSALNMTSTDDKSEAHAWREELKEFMGWNIKASNRIRGCHVMEPQREDV